MEQVKLPKVGQQPTKFENIVLKYGDYLENFSDIESANRFIAKNPNPDEAWGEDGDCEMTVEFDASTGSLVELKPAGELPQTQDVTFKAKSDAAAPGGWMARLMESGFKVSYRPGRFGDTEYLVKSGSESVKVVTNSTKARSTFLAAATPGQQAIFEAITKSGLAVGTPDPYLPQEQLHDARQDGRLPQFDQAAGADEAFADYDFGSGVEVTDTGGWEYETPGKERTRKVYVETEAEDDGPAPRYTLTFTVRFNPDGSVSEAYAIDNKGQVWGSLPREMPQTQVTRLVTQFDVNFNALSRNLRATSITTSTDGYRYVEVVRDLRDGRYGRALVQWKESDSLNLEVDVGIFGHVEGQSLPSQLTGDRILEYSDLVVAFNSLHTRMNDLLSALDSASEGKLPDREPAQAASGREFKPNEGRMSAEQMIAYLGTCTLEHALWWFIENVESEQEGRTDVFFYLRERFRNEAKPNDPVRQSYSDSH